jgi:phosphate uptake regulator
MDDSPEVIRLQMEETRASLSEKLETLEQQVVGTVQDARAAVTDTVETVKEAVHETVETVKDTFDIGAQMQRHPW